jgi:hypothetical protein
MQEPSQPSGSQLAAVTAAAAAAAQQQQQQPLFAPPPMAMPPLWQAHEGEPAGPPGALPTLLVQTQAQQQQEPMAVGSPGSVCVCKVSTHNPRGLIVHAHATRGVTRVALSAIKERETETRTHTHTHAHAIAHIHTQVDGCNIDLTEFQDNHRRSRVCKQHMRGLEVAVNGRTMRFCHQVRLGRPAAMLPCHSLRCALMRCVAL